MQPTVPMIPMTRSKKTKGKNHGALKKSQKVLAALVDAQIQINKQCGVYLRKPAWDTSKHFIYNALYSTGSPAKIPAIT